MKTMLSQPPLVPQSSEATNFRRAAADAWRRRRTPAPRDQGFVGVVSDAGFAASAFGFASGFDAPAFGSCEVLG